MKSVTAGLDVEMPARMVRYEHLGEAIEAGAVHDRAITRAVTHTMAALLRHATDPDRDRSPVSDDVLASPSHRALAREAAAKSIRMPRNEPVDGAPLRLPLDPARPPLGWRSSAGWPTSGTSAMAGRATCTPRRS